MRRMLNRKAICASGKETKRAIGTTVLTVISKLLLFAYCVQRTKRPIGSLRTYMLGKQHVIDLFVLA